MRTQTAILAMACLVSACASSGNPKAPRAAGEVDPLLATLTTHAASASQALNHLALVSQARTAPAQIEDPAKMPVELQRKITLVWQGPVEQVLQTLATEVGYGFEIYGRRPVAPTLVNIRTDLAPVYSILKDVGIQIADRGVVNVIPHTGIIELRYETE